MPELKREVHRKLTGKDGRKTADHVGRAMYGYDPLVVDPICAACRLIRVYHDLWCAQEKGKLGRSTFVQQKIIEDYRHMKFELMYENSKN